MLLEIAIDNNFHLERSTVFKISSRFKMIKPGIYFEAPAKPQQCTQVAAFKTDFTDIFVIKKSLSIQLLQLLLYSPVLNQ